MNIIKWVCYLLFSCLACSKPAAPPTINGPYQVSALLNDSTWYGSAYAVKKTAIYGQEFCTADRFSIAFNTDLPYEYNPVQRPVTGCLTDCVPTQSLLIANIPLAIGRFEIRVLNQCVNQEGVVHYFWLLGGDSIVNNFRSQTGPIGWIQISNYNAIQNAVEGRFELELWDKKGNVARFQNGLFKASVK